MRITDKLLDVLGFSEYWDNNGQSGCRTLTLPSGKRIRIVDVDETDDIMYGYGDPQYHSQYYYWGQTFAVNKVNLPPKDLVMLKDLYDLIKDIHGDEALHEFVQLLKDKNMYWCLED